YRTTIDLGADWTGDDGAYLELGEVNDTFHVRVNGELLPPCDPMDAVVDLGRRLVPGVNQIDVEVASTLINRLRVVTPSVYGVATRQNYGLVGPVRVVPYVEKGVPACGRAVGSRRGSSTGPRHRLSPVPPDAPPNRGRMPL